eukprot:461593_1
MYILHIVKSVTKKLLKDDVRYRTLDTTSTGSRRLGPILIQYKGTLDFLSMLGFKTDAMKYKLICDPKPPVKVIKNAVNALMIYQRIFSVFRYDYSDKNDNINLKQIIWRCTDPEYNIAIDQLNFVLLIHKMFTNSITLLNTLRDRFFDSIPEDILNIQNTMDKDAKMREYQIQNQKRIQLKVIKCLRMWMKNYWYEDFNDNYKLKIELQKWLTKMSIYNELNEYNKNCKWIPIIYNAIEKEYLSQINSSIDEIKTIYEKENILLFNKDIFWDKT